MFLQTCVVWLLLMINMFLTIICGLLCVCVALVFHSTRTNTAKTEAQSPPTAQEGVRDCPSVGGLGGAWPPML